MEISTSISITSFPDSFAPNVFHLVDQTNDSALLHILYHDFKMVPRRWNERGRKSTELSTHYTKQSAQTKISLHYLAVV